MEEMSYLFLLTLFSHCRSLSPWWPLVFLIFSLPLQIFHVVLPTKNISFVCLFFFFHLSLWLCVSLFLVELRRPVAFITFSFPCLSLSLYSKFVDMTINLSSILKTTRIQKQFPLAVFVFIDSLVVSASQDGSGYAISRQNNLEFHLGWHTCWLSYFTLVCLVGRIVTWLPRWMDYHIFLGIGLRSRARVELCCKHQIGVAIHRVVFLFRCFHDFRQ